MIHIRMTNTTRTEIVLFLHEPAYQGTQPMLQTKMQHEILRFGYLTSENDRGTEQPKDMNLRIYKLMVAI